MKYLSVGLRCRREMCVNSVKSIKKKALQGEGVGGGKKSLEDGS